MSIKIVSDVKNEKCSFHTIDSPIVESKRLIRKTYIGFKSFKNKPSVLSQSNNKFNFSNYGISVLFDIKCRKLNFKNNDNYVNEDYECK